jgi:hypothetical protein
MGQHLSLPITASELLCVLHGRAYIDVTPPAAAPNSKPRARAPKRERPASVSSQPPSKPNQQMRKLKLAAQRLAADPLASGRRRAQEPG